MQPVPVQCPAATNNQELHPSSPSPNLHTPSTTQISRSTLQTPQPHPGQKILLKSQLSALHTTSKANSVSSRKNELSASRSVTRNHESRKPKHARNAIVAPLKFLLLVLIFANLAIAFRDLTAWENLDRAPEAHRRQKIREMARWIAAARKNLVAERGGGAEPQMEARRVGVERHRYGEHRREEYRHHRLHVHVSVSTAQKFTLGLRFALL